MFFADGESDTKKTLGFGSKMTAGGILGHDGAKGSAGKLSKSFGTVACKAFLRGRRNIFEGPKICPVSSGRIVFKLVL